MSKVWVVGVAAIVAGAALAAVGWQARAQLGGARGEIRSARSASEGVVAGAPRGTSDSDVMADEMASPADGGRRRIVEDDDGPSIDMGPSAAGREFVFASHSSSAAAADALLNAEDEVRARADEMLGAALVAVPAVQRLGLVRSWMSLVEPIVRGDEDAFVSAATKLGAAVASTGGDDPVRSLFERVQGLIGGASLDPVSTEFAVLDDGSMHRVPRMPTMAGMERPGVAMMVAVTAEEGPDGVVDERRSVLIPLNSVFPDAVALVEDGARVAEVFTACRIAERAGAEADAGLSAYFAYNGAAAQWQPVGVRVELVSEAAQDRFSAMAREARERAAQRDGGEG